MNASAKIEFPDATAKVLSRSDPRWIRLHKIIKERSYMEGDFTLSSGKKSNYLFQLRQTTMHPEGASLIGGVIVDYMKASGLKSIGGLELGAVPVVASVNVESFHKNYSLDAFFVRKEPKKHGAREQIDGYFDPSIEVLLADDVATSGGSILKALKVLRSECPQTNVRRALVVVDREEREDGAYENLMAQGIELVSIFKRSDFS
jgi:orotate phosphoribosyltransferase